jgi:hypothetical protein
MKAKPAALPSEAAEDQTSVLPVKRGDSDATFKRLSEGRFAWWPSAGDAASKPLAAHQLAVLFSAGNPERTGAAPDWRPVTPRA